MDIDKAIRKRIVELIEEKKISLTTLSLNSNITPSTMFNIINSCSLNPKIKTIKKICVGAGITLEEFFARDYFNSTEDVYK